jgi:transposase
MARPSKRGPLALTPGQQAMLQAVAASPAAAPHESDRARVLLGYAQGQTIAALARQLGRGRTMVLRWIDRALAAGVAVAPPAAAAAPSLPGEIGDAARAWVLGLARTRPSEHGLAGELWSIATLARFVSQHAQAAGHARLARAGKSTVWRILERQDVKLHAG